MIDIYADTARPDNTGDGLTLATAKKTLGAAYALAILQTDSVTIHMADGNYMESGAGLVLASCPHPIIIESISQLYSALQVYPTTSDSPTAITFAPGFSGTITFRHFRAAPRNITAATLATIAVPTGCPDANITFYACSNVTVNPQDSAYSIHYGYTGRVSFLEMAQVATCAGRLLDIQGDAGMSSVREVAGDGTVTSRITVSGGTWTNNTTGACIHAKRSGVIIENIRCATTGNVSVWTGQTDATVPTYYADDLILRGITGTLGAASGHGILLGGGTRRALVQRCYGLNTGATAYAVVVKAEDSIIEDCIFIAPSASGGALCWKGAQNTIVRRCVIACGTGSAIRTTKGSIVGGLGQDLDPVLNPTLTDCIVASGASGTLYDFAADSQSGYSASGCTFSGPAGATAPDQTAWPLTSNAWATQGLATLADSLAQAARPAVAKAAQLATDQAAVTAQAPNIRSTDAITGAAVTVLGVPGGFNDTADDAAVTARARPAIGGFSGISG